MHVDVRGVEAVGERARENCGDDCGVAAYSVMVGGYVALAVDSVAGDAAAWESTAVEAVASRAR